MSVGRSGDAEPAQAVARESDGDPARAILPAATAVLVRENTGEVLLLLRNARHGFMANVWVFPGGRVDETDLLAGDGTAAFVHAALRETFEEAGILLTEPPRVAGPGQPRHFGSALGAGVSRNTRFLKIEPFARWVTPPREKKRYDTLFFCGLVPELEAIADDGEVVAARWIHPALALAEHRAGKLPLAPPTLLTLHSLLAASYTQEDGYDARASASDPPCRWSPAHAERLMVWVGSLGAGVVTMSPGLAMVEGRLVVAPEPWAPWPVPEALSRLRDIRLVDGHWELAFLPEEVAASA